MVLACEGAEGKHWFHPECAKDCFAVREKQHCIFPCIQRRLFPLAAEHHDHDYSYTFPNSPQLLVLGYDSDEDW